MHGLGVRCILGLAFWADAEEVELMVREGVARLILVDRGEAHRRVERLQFLVDRIGIGMRFRVGKHVVDGKALRCYLETGFAQTTRQFGRSQHIITYLFLLISA